MFGPLLLEVSSCIVLVLMGLIFFRSVRIDWCCGIATEEVKT
jgi:hypothetical protein